MEGYPGGGPLVPQARRDRKSRGLKYSLPRRGRNGRVEGGEDAEKGSAAVKLLELGGGRADA